jgi:sugar/nucleoside kinase (ribokinase family)
VLNDSEAKLLTEEPNVVAAGLEIARMVRRFVVVKKGEHGSLLFSDGKVAALPAYPAHKVVDPTGAGDSFAGAMMAHLASEDASDHAALRRSIGYGTVTASFVLEDFSLNGFYGLDRERIEERMNEFEDMTRF